MKGLAPHPVTRWVIGILVGLFFAIPMVATLLYTLRDGDGYSLVHWATLFDPASAYLLRPLWLAIGNSLIIAVVTVVIVLVLLAPTIVLVNLKFPRLRRVFEFVALLPISIPAIVLVVGLVPVYLQIGRTIGTAPWTLAFAYGITALPFAFRSIQASVDAIDLRTLTYAARTLGSGWLTVLLRVLAPNLRPGLLAASLLTVAVVLGEFTIASILNRQVLQTALLVVGKTDAYLPAIFTLLSLAAVFVLLLVIGRVGRDRSERTRS